jgi:hypothetical protein
MITSSTQYITEFLEAFKLDPYLRNYSHWKLRVEAAIPHLSLNTNKATCDQNSLESQIEIPSVVDTDPPGYETFGRQE